MYMKSHSLVGSRMVFTALCGAAIAGGVFAPSAKADQWDKKTVLTVDQPIQVNKTVLQPGTYVFKLLESQSDRHIVQIFNDRQDHLYATVLAIPNYRLEPTGHSRFAFWETPPGHVKALRAWFYPGDNFGQEFTYPKQLAMMETNTASTSNMNSSTTTTTENSTADRSAEVTPEPQPMTAQQLTVEQQTTEQPPVQMAENTPPAEQSEPTPAAPPQTLPKTASPYPLIGLSGLLLLGIRGFLRRRQEA